MPSKESQHTELQHASKNRYYGYEWAGALVYLLNAEKESPDIPPIREAVSICHRLIALASEANLMGMPFQRPAQGLKPPKTGITAEILKLEKRLRQIMQDFKSVPVITLSEIEGDGKQPSLDTSWDLAPDSQFAACSHDQPWPPHDALLRTIQLGAIAKVGSCTCGKYFFKKFAHQRFCSDTCRIRDNQNSPAAREYQRRKQREYYHLRKSGKA